MQDSFYKSLTPEQHEKAHANQFDFDSPDSIDFDALVQCLRDLKQGYSSQTFPTCAAYSFRSRYGIPETDIPWPSKRKKVDIPVYSFVHHQRQPQTTPLYSPHVLILEGILALHDPRIMDLLDVKVCFFSVFSVFPFLFSFSHKAYVHVSDLRGSGYGRLLGT